jgi:hypothetical protein
MPKTTIEHMIGATTMKRNIAILLLGIFVLTACGTPVSISTTIPTPPTSTATHLPPETPSLALTPAKTITPSLGTFESKPSCHTPICLSSVPAPTLSPLTQKKFFAMLENNGDCELPCFLGIIPGKTIWADANSILQPFDVNNLIAYDETRSSATQKKYHVQIRTRANREIPIELAMSLAIDVDQSDVVQHIVIRIELYGDGLLNFMTNTYHAMDCAMYFKETARQISFISSRITVAKDTDLMWFMMS